MLARATRSRTVTGPQRREPVNARSRTIASRPNTSATFKPSFATQSALSKQQWRSVFNLCAPKHISFFSRQMTKRYYALSASSVVEDKLVRLFFKKLKPPGLFLLFGASALSLY